MDIKAQELSTSAPRHLRVFLASPGDVRKEREEALKILADLPRDVFLKGRVTIEPVAWEQDGGVPLSAWVSPQEAIKRHLPLPCACDIVIVILWSRLGTPLPKQEGTKPDGNVYGSGTEWEYLNARQGQPGPGKPEILVYRCSEEPNVSPKDPERRDKMEQWDRLESFITTITPGGINPYSDVEDFKAKLGHHLKTVIHQWLSGEPHARKEDPPPPPEYQEAKRRYLDYVQDIYRYLNFRGMGFADRVPLRLPLVDLYTSCGQVFGF